MNQAEITSDGFRDQMINNNITGIRDSIGNLSTQLCNCCCDMRDTVNQGFYNSEIAAANRQMANMNQAFGLQNAISSGFNATQAQLAQCLKKIFNKAKKIFGFTNIETVGTLAV